MADSAEIFIGTAAGIEHAAEELARVLGGEVSRDDRGSVYVTVAQDQGRWVGGDVDTNIYRDDDQPMAWNGYPLVWGLDVPSRDEAVLRAASREVFDRLVAAGPLWPVLLVHNEQRLLAAARPGKPATEFPPGTTPDERHQDLWRAFDLMD